LFSESTMATAGLATALLLLATAAAAAPAAAAAAGAAGGSAAAAAGGDRLRLRIGALNDTLAPYSFATGTKGQPRRPPRPHPPPPPPPHPRPPLRARRPAHRAGINAFVRDGICAELNADCETVFLASFEERSAAAHATATFPNLPARRSRAAPAVPRRLTALEDGSVDLVVHNFAATPERAARVRFVPPFYALEAGTLYVPLEALAGAPTAWEGLAGAKVCVIEGSYLAAPLLALGAEPVPVAGASAFPAEIAAGRCVGGATGGRYSLLQAGLAAAPLPPLAAAPYGVAMSKDAAADDLAMRVSGAMVNLLTGPDAPLLEAETRAFASLGVEAGPALAQLSRALTTMDACPSAATEAGAERALDRRAAAAEGAASAAAWTCTGGAALPALAAAAAALL
jgi:ABC-type amino acid transport substrate-binding protein